MYNCEDVRKMPNDHKKRVNKSEPTFPRAFLIESPRRNVWLCRLRKSPEIKYIVETSRKIDFAHTGCVQYVRYTPILQ